MAGRNPRVTYDNEVSKKTKAEVQAIQDNLPVYKSQEFIPPGTLTKEERVIWDWLVNIFRNTVNCMVSDADVQLMELYCRAKAAADEADRELKKDNRAYILVPLGMDKDGKPKTTAKANPNIKKRHDNMVLCLRYFDQLGLSPLARAKAGLKGGNSSNEENKWEKFMMRSDD